MLRSSLRWGLILMCLFAVGPAIARLTGALHDATGGHATSLALNQNPSQAVMAAVVALVAAAVVGAVGTWSFTLGTGYACAGLVLAWARWGLGSVGDLVRERQGGGFLITLAAEGLVVSVAGAAIGALLMVINGRRQAAGAAPGGILLLERGENASKGAVLGVSLLAGVAAGGVVAWFCAVTDLKGQTLMAGVLAAIAAGAASHLAGNAMHSSVSPVPSLLAMALLGLVGPLLARGMHGEHVVEAVYGGALFGPGRLMSLDWAAGALLGVPIGMGWAGAMLDSRAAEAEAAAA